ncbi:DUF2891 domain-containing protein [Paraliomyxa miuraensis]|uniref:DUF2891 domain-containing protein n=1 Tax=Paraliomyxa miuraensis TaxID=376150 RepID=UPI00224ED98F|nr:DUF2891 domain-containing protein [Paraliomyxa miuraensis]MCX4245347.1 DUF2891 domain-containing protein [Paraliomyxa miuraensis]
MTRPIASLLALVAACASPAASPEAGSAQARIEAEAHDPPPSARPSVPPHVPAFGPSLDEAQAERFAAMALACVHREYPNKLAHVLAGPDDVGTPRQLTPVFYGCFDWHSAVHGHWLLVRLARRFPTTPLAAKARDALGRSFAPEAIAAEVRYLDRADHTGFERPYGLAWLLQLAAELRGWDDPDARRWSQSLAPLERVAAERLRAWVPKLGQPIRSGEHGQTGFGLGLALDWADQTGNEGMAELLRTHARRFHATDRDCALHLEPSGHDFLSPCLGAADLMRRVLPPDELARWLDQALPQIPTDGSADWLPVAGATDRTDGKLVHLDGLSLSRAWMLDGLEHGLPPEDLRRASLRAAAQRHAEAGLAAVSDEHYEGGHWLASFAVYLTTRRGRPEGGQF